MRAGSAYPSHASDEDLQQGQAALARIHKIVYGLREIVRQKAPRKRQRTLPIPASKVLTCDFSGALGGTRTPNLLIRRSGQVVQGRPSPVVGWADITELSRCVGCCSAAWLQSWLQSRRNGADPPALVVFKSMRGSLPITTPTSMFGVSARCAAQDHPAYIPRWPRPATNQCPVTIRSVLASESEGCG